MKNWSDVIWLATVLGLVAFAMIENDYPRAIFWYLVSSNLERKLNVR